MTREDYIQAVQQVLASIVSDARQRITACFQLIPAAATGASFDVFVDQDGEGFLDVRVSLEGRDLVPLNAEIQEHSEIVGTQMGETDLNPPFPLMDPDDDLDFDVQSVLADTASLWLRKLWKELGIDSSIPVSIASPEGYGTILPICLT